MAGFRFLHAADIHLDSPLHGLARYDGIPAEDVRSASRAAFDNLIDYACEEAVDFVLIAGDLFDGDWKDMSTGLYFARAIGRLAAADIPAFLLAGNHDAASVLTRQLPWPGNVHQFASRRPQTHVIDSLGVAIHGQSFANASVTDNLAAGYPPALPHHFNIGMLHTALGGHEGHAPYAPCEVSDLIAKGYDYWALGHVHEHRVVHASPHIVYPGNLQGRHIREAGAKGAVLVEVEDNLVTGLRHVPLDVLRWTRVSVDCAFVETLGALDAAISAALTRGHSALSDGRPLVARVVIGGATALAGALHDRGALIRDEVRALAAAIAPDLWIEKVQLDVIAPPDPGAPAASDDFLALLAEAADAPEFAGILAGELGPFLLAAAKGGNGDSDEGDLVALASGGDWPALVRTAGAALGARLSGAESR